ncbi:MAG: hypothetical protein EON85_08015 [Brevundimonas sp.]|nr:MAG: hypothetical protein EON85_08015 [Brevundimonas sp.]
MSGSYRIERARRLLALPDSWIEPVREGRYALRTGPDRRARIMLALDETEFRILIGDPGLTTRPGGGWTARGPLRTDTPAYPPGRPGTIDGVRAVVQPDGRITEHRANLATSPVAWLAGRTRADGRPWLSRAEVAAAERLSLEAETARSGPAVTMRWDALPQAGRGGSPRTTPGDRSLSAARRVDAALNACGPARAVVDHICIRGLPLQPTEQALGLRRRTGKAILKLGLGALARHYRLT